MGEVEGFLYFIHGWFWRKAAIYVSAVDGEGLFQQLSLEEEFSFGRAAEAVESFVAVVHLDGRPGPGGDWVIGRL